MFRFCSTKVMFVAVLLLLVGCGNSEPILIGYVGELSGKRAELGVDGRDGALLAVEHINKQGGIDGRPLKLVVKDDKGVAETARDVDAQLIKEGVVAIIGHMTSGQTAAVFEQMNEAKVVLVSPTAASTQFSNQADHFFRLIPTNETMAKALAAYIYAEGITQVTGVYDLGNQAYTEGLWQALQAEFETLGGDASQAITFTSGETDLPALITDLTATNPQAVVFISSAVDTALMVQYSRNQGLESPFFSVPWAQTQELIEKGGTAAEGLTFSSVYDPDNQFSAFQPYLDGFNARYNREPGFGAAYGYEAMLLLATALKQTKGQAQGLPQALTAIDNLTGVQGIISMNEYGDVERDVYISAIQDGQFKVIDAVSLTD